MIKNILKYQGNTNYICILYSDENAELFVLYALTEKMSIEINRGEEESNLSNFKTTLSCENNYEVIIPILESKNSIIFHTIKIDNEKEYEHICTVMESLI